MNNIDKNELMVTLGGVSITGAILNAIRSLGNYVYSLGQSLGSSIRRIASKKVCSCK